MQAATLNKDLTIYADITNTTATHRAFLNLAIPGLIVGETVSKYIKFQFLQSICESIVLVWEMSSMMNCYSGKNTVSGLPLLELQLTKDAQYLQFNSTEYFLYPIHNNNTIPRKAVYGLDFYNYNTSRSLN